MLSDFGRTRQSDEIGAICDYVLGTIGGEECDSGGSDDKCCVSANSVVSSTGSARQDGGRERVRQLSAVMGVWGFLVIIFGCFGLKIIILCCMLLSRLVNIFVVLLKKILCERHC